MSLKELQNQIDCNLREHPIGTTFSSLLPPSLPTLRNRMELEGSPANLEKQQQLMQEQQ